MAGNCMARPCQLRKGWITLLPGAHVSRASAGAGKRGRAEDGAGVQRSGDGRHEQEGMRRHRRGRGRRLKQRRAQRLKENSASCRTSVQGSKRLMAA